MRESIFSAINDERLRQQEMYGDNHDNLDGTGRETRWLLPYTTASASDIETDLRFDYEDFEEDTGSPTWVHLLREEFAEVCQEDTADKLEGELVQLAALCVSWIESLRVRGENRGS